MDGVEYDNARDGALSRFFPFCLVNMLGGSGASNMDALGVGWEEQRFLFCFPNIGASFLFYV